MTTDRMCKRRQEDMVDVFYNEKTMIKELEEHLENCHECRTHWKMLHDLKEGFEALDIPTETDITIIREAFQIVDERERVHKERMDFIIFLILATVIMFGVVGAAVLGYSIVIIIALAAFTVLSPFVVPVLFIMKLKREDA